MLIFGNNTSFKGFNLFKFRRKIMINNYTYLYKHIYWYYLIIKQIINVPSTIFYFSGNKRNRNTASTHRFF